MSERVLPEGWVETTLGQVVEYGKAEKATRDQVDDDTWVLELEDIEKSSSKILQRLTFSERHFKSTKNRFKKGDVLYGKLRPYLDKVVIADRDGVCTTEIVPLDARPHLENRYLFYWLKSLDFLSYVNKVGYGVNMPRLGTKEGKAAPFVFAPQEEQKAIADKLDELLAQVSNLVARLDTIPAILKRFRQSVLAAAVSGRLTEEWGRKKGLSLEWAQVEVGMLAKKEKHSLCIGPFGSSLKVKDYRSSGHPLVFVREIRARCFGDSTTKFIDGEKFAELSSHRARPGDLLITKMGDPPGDVAFYPVGRPEGVITADCIKLDVDKEVAAPEYVYYAMQSPIFRKRVVDASAGVAQKKVNLKNFKAIPFDLPGLEEQTEIVRRVDQLFAFADQIERQVKNAQARVNKLTQSILAKAFRGELTAAWRAQNPELISGEHSAEALLERIKAEKAKQKPAGRGRKKSAAEATG